MNIGSDLNHYSSASASFHLSQVAKKITSAANLFRQGSAPPWGNFWRFTGF